MINIDEKKLGTIRHYRNEISIMVLSCALVYMFRYVIFLHSKIDTMRVNEIEVYKKDAERKDENAKYWREAFITTAQYSKFLQQEKDSIK